MERSGDPATTGQDGGSIACGHRLSRIELQVSCGCFVGAGDAIILVPNTENDSDDPTDTAKPGSLFKWETVTTIGPHTLNYEQPVSGSKLTVELTCGRTIEVFRAD